MQGSSYDLQGSGGSGIPLGGGSAPVASPIYLQGGNYNVQPNYGVPQSTQDPSSVLGESTTNDTTTPTDPYAAWGGFANYQNLVNNFNAQDTNIHSTADEAANTSASQLHSSILDYLYQTQKGQNTINESAVQNELAKRQGFSSILDMVNSGIAGGRARLAQGNAGTSTVLEALARAYSGIANRQGKSNLLQYTQGQRSIDQTQADLEAQKALGVNKLKDSETNAVNNIVLDARTKLAALDAAQRSNLLPGVDIEAEKAQIKDSVLGILSQYDQMLAEKNAAIAPTSSESRRQIASDLFSQGATPDNPFSLQTFFPIQVQSAGTSSLPLFLSPPKKSDNTA